MAPRSTPRCRGAAALLCLLLAACADDAPPAPPVPSPQAVAWQATVAPILGDYCVGCHGGTEPSGDLSFEPWLEAGAAPTAEILRAETPFFERMGQHIATGTMPPPGEVVPTPGMRAAVAGWLDEALAEAWRTASPDPGRVTMRRLSRYEYRNTVRDLLGVDYDTTATFPVDDVGYGFDHIGDVLSMPPILFEKYLDAAETIAEEAILVVDPQKPSVRRYEAQAMERTTQGGVTDGGVWLYSNGEVHRRAAFPRTGFYLLRVGARAKQAGPDAARVALRLDRRTVLEQPVQAPAGVTASFEVKVRVEEGDHGIAAAFTNDYYDPKHPDREQRDRNLWVDAIEIVGPLAEELVPSEAERRLITCEPTAGQEADCARRILAPLLTRAFRRPPTAEQLRTYVTFVTAAVGRGEPFRGALRTALEAVLVAPQFLFRMEIDEQAGGATIRPLDAYELASRLSYFLWSSLPDAELLEAAGAGTLQANLHDQVTRMLGDEKARALVENFAVQWLELRRLETVTPDPKRFAAFTEDLRAAMRTETELFVAAIVREDRSILDLLDAPFTYVNGPLARHYRIPGITGEAFQRVDLRDPRRGGLLGQASILTLTSYPTRTSPVLRGKWLLEEILGTPPPPPPPGVGTLEAQAPEMLKLSLRERLAAHRENPACAVCHDRMDNLGYGLENYDPIGAWRAEDGMTTIDSAGLLPDGRAFAGPAQLKRILRNDPGFPRCFAEKLLTYALGRGLEPYDRRAVLQVVREAQERGWRFSAFVHAVVATDAFTMRRSQGEAR